MDAKKSQLIFVLCFSLLAKSWGKPFNEYEVGDADIDDDSKFSDGPSEDKIDDYENENDNDGQSASDVIYQANSNANMLSNLFEEDILVDPARAIEIKETINGTITKRAAIKGDEYKWPDKTLYYEFGDYKHSKNNFDAAVKEIESKTCIKIKKGKTTKGHFVKVLTAKGCFSNVGNIRKRYGQTLSIGRGCNIVGVIIHELTHALGFWHEQSRPDRDEYVKVIVANIKPGRENQFLKYSWNTVSRLGVPYDYDSVMHYGATAFSKDRRANLKTIVRLDDPNKPLGQRRGLSKADALELRRYYNCPAEPMHCNFDSGSLCQWSNVGRIRFAIRRGSTPSLRTGPTSDHTSGQGRYIYLEASAPRKEGENAAIISKPLQATKALCVNFWYNMYGAGAGMGKLNMDIFSRTRNEKKTLWSKSGNQGKGWKEAKVTVKSTETFNVVFNAIRGPGYRSDIALDDITLTPGRCTS